MHLYKVVFVNQGKVYEVYAKTVRQGELYGFVEVESLVFDTTSSVVVDPSEERLKSEFGSVRRSLIPIHAVVRIDEVEKQGPSRILSADKDAKVTPFPGLSYTPDKRQD